MIFKEHMRKKIYAHTFNTGPGPGREDVSTMKKKLNRWLWTGMFMLFVALVMAGCSTEGGGGGGGDDGTTAGVPAEITFKTFNSTVAIDSVMTITASVKDSNGNNVADATSVSLSDEKGLVTITPSSQETVDGKATFVITGKVAGIANLIAQAGGAISTISITIVDTAPQIILSADETTIRVGRTIEISATVMESDGTLVPDDTEITFDVSDATLAELSESTAMTSNGVATVTLSAIKSGTVQVGATYGAGTGTIEITIADQSASTPASITLSSTSTSVQMGNTATITATVRDAAGLPVIDGTAVQFTVDSDSGSVSPGSSTTSSGTATTTFTGDRFGIVTITATAGTATGTVTINVTANVTYLSISTTKTAVKTDNIDTATITATALDQNRVPVEYVPISFTATAGQLSDSRVDTDENGEAKITFKSGAYDKANQTVTITATAPPNRTASIPIQLTGTTVALTIAKTSLQASPVPTSTTLTVSVKDGGGIAVFDTDVNITQSSLGNGSVLLKEEGDTGTGTTTLSGSTDVTGKFIVTVTGNNAGTLPVTLTASALGANASKDVTVSGLPFELLAETAITAGPATVFAFYDNAPAADTITRSDVGGSFIVDGFTSNSVVRVTGSGSNNGIYDVASLTATTLTLGTNASLTTEAAGANVTITRLSSDQSVISADTSSSVLLWVRSPSGHPVTISTTIGTLSSPTWTSGNNTAVLTATPDPVTKIVSITLTTPGDAGIATVMAEDATSPTINDSLNVAISAPVSDAAQIAIQASPTVIPISSGSVTNVSTLIVTVRNSTGEVVSNVPVHLSLGDRTGGGEYISPTLLYTNNSGQAEATFYAGTLGSGSEGVEITAEIVGAAPPITDSIRVVIGGAASSVAIGAPTSYSEENASLYRIPMTLMVADANGNPVNGANVNLSVWPLGYYTSDTGAATWPARCCANYYPNEDIDRNELIGIGEDSGPYPGANNGVLDPPKSSAGTVPATVTTNENGVGEFNYYWQKIYAAWTKVEIRASVVVYGSETIAVLNYGPTLLEKDAPHIPLSPWGDCGSPPWPCP